MNHRYERWTTSTSSSLGFRRRTLWLRAAQLAGAIVLALGLLSGGEELKAQSSPSQSGLLLQACGRALQRLVNPPPDAPPERDPEPGALPLDLSKFYNANTNSLRKEKGKLSGRVVFHGVPFEVGGALRLYGETQDERGDHQPLSVKGLHVDRKFQYLHLVHYTTWPDAEGQTVCYVCLNYDDGTEAVLPLRYGVHLRDWFHLPSYEKEAVKDPNTTICWRRDPVSYKAPVRLFLSKLANPSPDKVVKTIDFVSARSLAGYNVIAATVADGGRIRAEKPIGDRKFDGKLRIRVVDDSTGLPIEGALVYPSMNAQDEGVVGTPVYSSSTGTGTIPFPTKDTKYIMVSVKKEGYRPDSHYWEQAESGDFTFRLAPVSDSEER